MNFFSILLVLIVGLTGFCQETVDRVLAVVDDNIILESEVLQFAQSLALQNRTDPMKYIQDDEIRTEILNQLIEQQVILSKAKNDTNIIVEDREVKRELENRMQMMIGEAGSEAELEKLYGKPVREIRREFEKTILEGLMVEKMRQRKIFGVKVSRSEVEDFYREYKAKLSSKPETVELAHILLNIEPSKEAESRTIELIDSISTAISNGADFSELAKEYSHDPGSSKRGGKLGWAKRGDFVPEYEEAAFNLESGKVSPPVKTRFGYHLILLNERQGEKINTSHILIKLEPTADDQRRVMALADSLYSLLEQGQEFGEIAQEFSQDKTTADEGGRLGSFKINEMIPIFTEQIKNLEPGEYTKPFESVMGVQILAVINREKPRELTLTDDWERISQFALNNKQEKVYQDWVSVLKKEVYIKIKN